jgi:Glutamine amidotransferase class-I
MPKSCCRATPGLSLQLAFLRASCGTTLVGPPGTEVGASEELRRIGGRRSPGAYACAEGADHRPDVPSRQPGSKAAAAVYGAEVIYERHGHRFEVNNRYRQALEGAGMLLSGQSPDGRLVEIVELKDHPWFVASQFHPEFKSRPERPHPLFDGFVAASLAVRDGREPVFAARLSQEPAAVKREDVALPS